MDLGASFSHFHLKELGLDIQKSLKEFKSLGLTWVRIGAYWNEIEKEKGKYNFEELEEVLSFCDKNKLNVAMTVGMKAPRYPEYFFPKWLEGKIRLRKLSKIKAEDTIITKPALKFTEATVTTLKKHESIKVWQVENEPLDISGPNWLRIDKDFLEKETNLVRSLDPKRKVIINLWGNELARRKNHKKAINMADIIGINLYMRHPAPLFNLHHRYIGPLDSKKKIKEIFESIKSQGKSVWLTELQVEPWEPGELVSSKENPPSFLPKHFKENLDYGINLKPNVILLWGFEYWLWKKSLGDKRYWNVAKKSIKNFKI